MNNNINQILSLQNHYYMDNMGGGIHIHENQYGPTKQLYGEDDNYKISLSKLH